MQRSEIKRSYIPQLGGIFLIDTYKRLMHKVM